MRWISLVALLPAAVIAQQPGQNIFPPVVKGIEYRLKYGRHPDEGWQDGMRFEFAKEECLKRLELLREAPGPRVCMIRPETTSL
ncbi:hypothetical protein WHZ77_17345 [Bradyrhizobium sp. A5]|uniref:hypothetical protein n=1 Tax=Bradyrhizobium sp. A5 TaxID=3133696 RepID=UPI00324D2968